MNQMQDAADRSKPATPAALHVDSDWKAQAEAEREKLRKLDSERAATAEAEQATALPPADFRSIVGLLATQALGGLGAYGDPETRRIVVDLPAAQFAIDLLGVLAEKTKGNLSTAETTELTSILAELRSRFVQIAQLVAAQQAQGGAVPLAANPASSARPETSAKSKLIIPG